MVVRSPFVALDVSAKRPRWPSVSVPDLDLNGPRDVAFRRFERNWVDRPAIELFAEVAAQRPDAIACEDLDGGVTFAALWRAARWLARTIDTAIPAGSAVGVLLPNQASYPAAVLACLGAARPCVLIDRNYPPDRVAAVVRDAGLGGVIMSRADIASGYLLPAEVRPLAIEDAFAAAELPSSMPAAPSAADSPSFIVYTSGSTGHPKGIVLSQRAVLHRAAELVHAVHLHAADKVLSLASPGTIGGLQQIFEVMLCGATLVKLDLQRIGLGQVLRAVAERRITMMFSTPAVWRSVAQLDGARDALTSLRCIQSSGDILLRVDYELVRKVLPSTCAILSVYGATEAPALLQWFVSDPPHDEARVPVGYPLPDIDLAVVDEHGRPVAEGEEGELVIRSAFTSLGLWRSGSVVPEPFEIDPSQPQLKTYRTGDLVRRRTDGLYVVLGRRDRQIKIRGNRVELAEIETALRRLPSVRDAAVIARLVGNEPHLLAFVVPVGPATAEFTDEVRAHLAQTLPPYMRPRALHVLDALPLLPGRKVDEAALLAHASAEGDGPSRAPAPAQSAGPQATAWVNKAWRAAVGRRAPVSPSTMPAVTRSASCR
jgi:amino acid adenylation domain-containing protein